MCDLPAPGVSGNQSNGGGGGGGRWGTFDGCIFPALSASYKEDGRLPSGPLSVNHRRESVPPNSSIDLSHDSPAPNPAPVLLIGPRLRHRSENEVMVMSPDAEVASGLYFTNDHPPEPRPPPALSPPLERINKCSMGPCPHTGV